MSFSEVVGLLIAVFVIVECANIIGFLLGKPYLDKWQQRRHALKMPVKPAPKPPVPMPGMGAVPSTGPTTGQLQATHPATP